MAPPGADRRASRDLRIVWTAVRVRAVEHEQERIPRANSIIAAVFQFRKALKIVVERKLTPAQVMVAEYRVHGNTVLVPDRGLHIPCFPVIGIIAVINDISAY